DLLRGLTVGRTAQVVRAGTRETMEAVVTEFRPPGAFATWQAERAVGDHDRNTLRPRLDPQGDASGLEPGRPVVLSRCILPMVRHSLPQGSSGPQIQRMLELQFVSPTDGANTGG